MSRSKTEIREKIAHKYFNWSSEAGTLKYFDKSATNDKNPKGQNITIELPFTFVPLDVLATIKGWHDGSSSAIYSNEVKDISKQELTVKTFKTGELATGLYSSIKDKIVSKGGKFTNSVYIGYYEGKDFVIGNIQIAGASLGSWIDYCKKYPRFRDEGAVKITGFTKEKKGATKFTKPVFEYCKLSEATQAQAIELDEQLQAYLKVYFEGTNEAAAGEKITSETNPPEDFFNDEPDSFVGADSESDMPF